MKSLSIFEIASWTEPGWPKVLQASEVPQNQVILEEQRKKTWEKINPVEITWESAL